MNKNKKALGIMLGTLVFLLVLAVVLLSVIIVSLARDDKPAVTTPIPTLSQSRPGVQTSYRPHTVKPFPNDPPRTTMNPGTGSPAGSSDNIGDPSRTTGSAPATTTPKETRPPVTGPNVPIGEIVTTVNPDGSMTRSGAFRDNGSTALHMVIEWEAAYASQDAGSVNLTVRVYLQCYSIGVAARDNGTLSIAGQTTTFQTPNIYYNTNDNHYTLLTSRSVTVPKESGSAAEVDISAAWNYKGTYSGVPMEWVTVAGTIEL